MSVVTVGQESIEQGAFYTPRFELRIEGVGLLRNVLRDVLQVTYKDNVKELDSIELTVNNWDDATHQFKYVGAETRAQLAARNTDDGRRFRLFEPCNKEFQLRLGYLPELTLMMTGTFTTLEPNFPSDGASTLSVRGLNVLHQLRRKQYTYAWENKRDSEIAQNIQTLRDRDDRNRKRFPLPIEINGQARADEASIDYVAQENQYDIDFLMQRARKRGYVVFVSEGNQQNPRKHLYFGPSQNAGETARDVTFELAWGQSLIDFKPTLTTANQIRSVTVKGWNRRRKREISETVSLDDRRLNRNRDLYEVLQRCDPREEHVVNEPVFSPSEARRRAEAILMDRQKEMVKASGTTIGLPDLRAGRNVHIRGLGARFSGLYFVTETTHTVDDNGYITKFQARREDEDRGDTP